MDLFDGFDLDLSLEEAALDDACTPARRAIANLCIGMDTLDAYHSVEELRQAAAWVHEGDPPGKRKLAVILGNAEADDFQRCIYYALAGRGVVAMLNGLDWLVAILRRRAQVAGELHRDGKRMRTAAQPYVAPEPDGPVGAVDPGFAQGPSWWVEPGPRR